MTEDLRRAVAAASAAACALAEHDLPRLLLAIDCADLYGGRSGVSEQDRQLLKSALSLWSIGRVFSD